MAHEIEIINEQGQAFFVGEAAWHKLGRVIVDAPTTKEGIILAGLDWNVKLAPLQTIDGLPVEHKATVREKDNKVLGVVGPNWTPLQNTDAFSFFDVFLEQGLCKLDAAGSLRQGRTVWVLAKIVNGAGEVVPGDKIESYLLLSNAHDGTQAVRVGFSSIRCVCQNTLTAAHNSKDSQLVRIVHGKNVKNDVEAVRDVINLTKKNFEASIEQYKLLQKKTINQADIEKFVAKIFFDEKKLEDPSDRLVNKYKQTLEKILDLTEIGLGADLPGIKGTAYGLYNATTEYLAYHKGDRNENRLNSLWFGADKERNQAAFDYLLAA